MIQSRIIYSLFCVVVFSVLFVPKVKAQVPEGVNYQAIARDNNGNALANQMISVRFGIIQTSASGTLLYEEEFSMITTNDFGLFNLLIGQGVNTNNGSLNSFSEIDWGSDVHFLKVEIDPGSGYENLGTTQLVSVPYALYAKESGSILNAGAGILIQNDSVINIGDLSESNELINQLGLNGETLEITDAGGTQSVDLSVFNDSLQIVDSSAAIRSDMLIQQTLNDSSQAIRMDMLSQQVLNDTSVAIRTDLNTLSIGAYKDSSSTNELNTNAVLNGETLEITDAGGTQSVDLSVFNDSLQIVDSSAAIRSDMLIQQTLNDSSQAIRMDMLSQQTLNDTSVAIRADLNTLSIGAYKDSSATNELNTNAVLNGETLEITDAGGTQSVDLSVFNDSLQIVDSSAAIRSDMLIQQTLNDSSQAIRMDMLSQQVLNDTSVAIRTDLNTLSIGAYKDSSAINELNTNVVLSGETLEITDAGGTQSVDLSVFNDSLQIVDSSAAIRSDMLIQQTLNDSSQAIRMDMLSQQVLNDTSLAIRADLNTLNIGAYKDSSSTNELNTNAVLNGETLEITDAGGTQSVDLSVFNDSLQIVDSSAVLRNSVNSSNSQLRTEIGDTANALRTDLSTFKALSDSSAALRFDLVNNANVFTVTPNTANRLAYWIASDTVGYFNVVTIDEVNNRLGIGTTSPNSLLDVNGVAIIDSLNINNQYSLPSNDGNADDYLQTDGSGNLSWVSIDTATCPTGMTNIAGRICIETNQRAPANWFTAASTCVSEGMKLPSWGEWYGALDNGTLNNEVDDWEWVDDGTSNTVRKVGNGSLTNNANDDPATGSASFRCILILK